MRNNKLTIAHGVAVLAGVLTLGLAGTAVALHDGGVAHCDACHSMHNSPENPVEGTPNTTLLKGTDPSSTCLNCHAGSGSYHIFSTDASNQSPGGDFFWLTQSYTNVVRGNPVTSDPDNMGHNVIASDYGLLVDGTNTTAPGGTYPAGDLYCTSCHDPHGRVAGGTENGQLPISVSGSYGAVPVAGTIAGNYRLLADEQYTVSGTWGSAAITAPAPIAATASWGETDASHPAYGMGMSEWCASCHGTYINDNHKHPAGNGEFLNGQASNYNSYVKTGDFTGDVSTSFTALVQFERQETDKTVLAAAVTSLMGPDSSDNVMCLTCHRAHASAFNNITRWDTEHELLAESTPNAANLVAMGALPNSAYYGRVITTEFGDFQRSLCNKCHVKD
jgi:nitrate/TMAO reductase-like tetraheme cytochrome c subunit